MGRGHLGEFEQIVLLAVARVGDRAYGMQIRREIEDRSGRAVTIGAVYATLDRLAAKGLLSQREDTASGRARRFYGLSNAGIAALEAARDHQMRMWSGLRLRRSGRHG